MNHILSYSGLTTKVRAMHSRLLTRAQLLELTGCSSIAEAAAYLKRQPEYSHTFENLDEGSLHRNAVEMYLKQSIFQDFSRIFRFCNLKQRKFLKLYVIRYETAFLKLCLRTVYDENPIIITDQNGGWFYKRYFSFDIQRISSASTLGSLIECLRGSAYYDILSGIYRSADESTTLFDYEMALDLFFFRNIWQSVNKLFSGDEKQAFLESYGTKIDMLNIQWIYRSRRYYSMSPKDIEAILIPARYRLKKETIRAMTEAESPEALADLICSTRYGREFTVESPVGLEHLYRSILNAVHKTEVRKYPYSMISVDSYLYAKEQETDLITTVIEGIRYGLSRDEIAQYIY